MITVNIMENTLVSAREGANQEVCLALLEEFGFTEFEQ